MTFHVDIEQYSGPLDLLLYIVRREEIALVDLPLSVIADQFLSYLEVLVELDIDDVADFIDVASLLVEMKSKQVIPQNSEEENGEHSDEELQPSEELAYRLMEYKRIRDAASLLDEQGQRWQMRYSRLASDLPPRKIEIGEQPIEPIEVWDLVSAFGRILRERQPPESTSVVYDNTPIHEYMQHIHGLVRAQGRVELTSLFQAGMHKSALVAMFLAALELTRHHGLSTEQRSAAQPLFLVAGKQFNRQLDVHEVENLSHARVAASNMPVAPR